MRLADPNFNMSKEIGLLLSSDVVFNVLCNGKISSRYRKLPFILNSKLGWLFVGACDSMFQSDSTNSLFSVHVVNQLDEEGWYVVRLPRKEDVSKLGDSRSQALKSFYSLEKRLNSSPDLKEKYVEFMEEYKKLGHMSQIDNPCNNDESYYIPHHPVFKPTSTSTK